MASVVDAVEALQQVGLSVSGYGDWENRSNGNAFQPEGLIFHHDATPIGPSPSVKNYMWETASIRPACHFWVDLNGAWWVGCANGANHAGVGEGWGIVPINGGNRYTFGVETDHTVNETWTAVQYDSIVRGFAAICRRFGWNPGNRVMGHKEYTSRKIDPWGVSMDQFRADVVYCIEHGFTPHAPAPTKAFVAEEDMAQFIAPKANTWPKTDGQPGPVIPPTFRITGPFAEWMQSTSILKDAQADAVAMGQPEKSVQVRESNDIYTKFSVLVGPVPRGFRKDFPRLATNVAPTP